MRPFLQKNTSLGVTIITLIFVVLITAIILFSNEILTAGPEITGFSRTLIIIIIAGLPTVLLGIISFQITRLFHQRTTNVPGAKLKTRLVLFFTLVITLSVVPIALLSITFINSGVRLWLNTNIGDALESGEMISLEYYKNNVTNLESFANSESFLLLINKYIDDPNSLWEIISETNSSISFLQVIIMEGNNNQQEDNTLFMGDPVGKLLPDDPLLLRRGTLPRDSKVDKSILRYAINLQQPNKNLHAIVGVILSETFNERASSLTDAIATFKQLDLFQDIFLPIIVGFYLIFSLPILFLAILASFLLADALIIPIANLVKATRRVAEGDFSFRVLTRQDDELATLVNSFNRMIGELETSRKQVRQAQKISTWQEIAQRMAHEIRNPLTPIRLSAERITKTFNEKPHLLKNVIYPSVNAITKEVSNLDSLLAEFREFARLPNPTLKKTNLKSLISEVAQLYAHVNLKVSINFTEISKEINLLLDPSQIQRALANLVKNAIQAMPNGGKVFLRAYYVQKDTQKICRIQVSDSGKGIAKKFYEKIFDPYFTTEENGTGLGLAIVERIVFDHGGNIWFESQLNQGSNFYIDLPFIKSVNQTIVDKEK